MSAPSSRRPRRLAPLVGAVLALGLLAGCAGTRDPKEYGRSVETAWTNGCLDTAEADAKAVKDGGEGTALNDPETFCQCAYDALSDPKTGLPFDKFAEINNTLREEPGKLPSSVTKVFADCTEADQKAQQGK